MRKSFRRMMARFILGMLVFCSTSFFLCTGQLSAEVEIGEILKSEWKEIAKVNVRGGGRNVSITVEIEGLVSDYDNLADYIDSYSGWTIETVFSTLETAKDVSIKAFGYFDQGGARKQRTRIYSVRASRRGAEGAAFRVHNYIEAVRKTFRPWHHAQIKPAR